MANEWDKVNQSVLDIAVKASLKKTRKPSVLTELKKITTWEDWDAFTKRHGLSRIVDISHRGGKLGVYATDFINKFLKKTEVHDLPTKIGAYCNYLGGGMRGSILTSDYDRMENKADEKIVEAFLEACVRAYNDAESEEGVPDDAINTGYGRANVASAY
jgi:hypothetical protein